MQLLLSDILDKVHESDCLLFVQQMPDSCVDLIILDPPYLVTQEDWDQKEVMSAELCAELYRVAKDSCSLYCWCGIGEKSQSLIRWFPILTERWIFKDLITWKKSRGIGMRKGWLYTREEIVWLVKDNTKFIWNIEAQYLAEKRSDEWIDRLKRRGDKTIGLYKRISNVWTDIQEKIARSKKLKFHYTPKPEKAIERIILAHTNPDDVVLSPFIGSGTDAVVAKRLGRHFIGVEIDPKYCELAKRRIG